MGSLRGCGGSTAGAAEGAEAVKLCGAGSGKEDSGCGKKGGGVFGELTIDGAQGRGSSGWIASGRASGWAGGRAF